MRKLFSVLVALGIIWLFTVPNFAAQDKEFKSELNDVKDPKKARWLVATPYGKVGLHYARWDKDLDVYFQNSQINSWLNEGKFALKDLMGLRSGLNKMYEYLEKAAELLQVTQNGQVPVLISLSNEEWESYQGTLEDVKKAEAYIFKAEQLRRELMESPVLELIERDKKGDEEVRSTPKIWYHIQLAGSKDGNPGYYEGSVSANTEIIFDPQKPELICKDGGYFSVYDPENCLMYANFSGRLDIFDWRIWSVVVIAKIEGRTSQHESWYKRVEGKYKEMTPEEIQELEKEWEEYRNSLKK